MRDRLRHMIAILAVPVIGMAIYAAMSGDTGLLMRVIGLIGFLFVAAYTLGMFKRKPRHVEPETGEVNFDFDFEDEDLARLERKPAMPEPTKDLTDLTPQDAETGTEDEIYLVFAQLAGLQTGDEFREHANQIAADHLLQPLSPADVDRLAEVLDQKDLRAKAFRRTPGIAFARQIRAEIDLEYAGTSWLGGTPTLGDLPWPRDESGRAMHHLAQIDLATLPLTNLPDGLPKTGALAFFMTTMSDGPFRSKVVYLPKIGSVATEPPEDTRPLYEGPEWGRYMRGHAREVAPITFPRWPIDMIALPMSDPDQNVDASSLMTDLLPEQATSTFTPQSYAESLPDFARPWFWDTAHRVVHSLRIARDDIPLTIARLENRADANSAEVQSSLETLRNEQDAFSQYVDEVSIWAITHEPWEKMSMADAAVLNDYFAQVWDRGAEKAPFRPFYKRTQGELQGVRAATEATLLAAASGPTEAYHKLPVMVRADIDTIYRTASAYRWHQMFGLGQFGEIATRDHRHHHLLLQLHTDQLQSWFWGGDNVVQFWISEDGLRAQDWDGVEMTVEGPKPV